MGRKRGTPRVLYLAFFFPPSRGSGVYRARGTANYLVQCGWDVTVLAAPERFPREVIGSFDDALVATVDPQIRVERPSMRYFSFERDVRRFSWFRAHLPIVAQKVHGFGKKFLFPDRYTSWWLPAVRRGLRLHMKKKFDLILATGNPWVSFAVAWTLSRLTGVPYILDYRDAWTLDEFADEPLFPPRHVAWRWERRFISRAAAVTFVNEAQREWHAKRYPKAAERMLVVLNGWDPDIADPAAPPSPAQARLGPAAGGPVQFTFLGTLTAQQPIAELVAAFQLARQDPVMSDARLNLYGYLGYFHPSSNSSREVRERLGAGSIPGLVFHGPVPKQQVSTVYRDTDVLVFLAAGGKYVTSGKVFELVATGLPIVSVHERDIAAREVLTGYPLWFDPGGLEVSAIAKSMVEAAHAARKLTPEQRQAAREHAAAFERRRVLAPLERRMREILGLSEGATP